MTEFHSDHGDLIITQHNIPQTSWKFVLLLDKESLLANSTKLKDKTNVVGFIALGLMVLFYLIFLFALLSRANQFSNQILSPLYELIEATKKFKDKLTTMKMERSHIIEINTLLDNFTAMSQELQELYDSMDRKIKEGVVEKMETQKMMIYQSRLAQMGEMISMIAHQWRQPLGAISAVTASIKLKQSLKKFDLLTEEGRKEQEAFLTTSISKIDNYIQFLTTTIDDFRNFFRPEQQHEQTSLKIIIERALNLIGKSLEVHKITLNFTNSSDNDLITYETQVMQVIINIIKNAQDVILEKKLENGTIWLNAYEENAFFVITIEDNAGGIPESIITKIFDPYFSTKSERNGTGLGLYMSKTIIEEHCHGAVYVKTLDTLYQVKLPYHGVTTLSRTQKYFIMGFKTGEILFYNHREFEEQFINYIKLKQVKEACLIFQKNIFLMSHRETKKIYEYWLEQKETIMNLLSRGDIEQAQKIAEPFLFHPKCKLQFAEIEELQPDLMALQRYIRSMSYAPAYDLVRLKPELKKSSLFKQIEALWSKNLQTAQILLAREPLLNKEAAKESLHAFLDVEEKKPLIENMLKRSGTFTLAETAVKEKHFSFYFRLVAQNNFLESTPLYQKVLQVGERLQQETLKYLEEKNYQQSLILADILYQFRPYQNQATKLKEASKALLILEYQIEHKMLLEAVKTQDQYQLQSHYALVDELEEMKQTFHDHQITLVEAKEYDKVFKNIEPYMKISICKQHIANIMKKIYISQFHDAQKMMDSAIDWEKSFLTYLQFFPMDKRLSEFAKENHKLDVLQRIIISSAPKEDPIYPKQVLTYLKSPAKKMG